MSFVYYRATCICTSSYTLQYKYQTPSAGSNLLKKYSNINYEEKVIHQCMCQRFVKITDKYILVQMLIRKYPNWIQQPLWYQCLYWVKFIYRNKEIWCDFQWVNNKSSNYVCSYYLVSLIRKCKANYTKGTHS